tara:strand:+ start:15202 stop:15849 length:648 start_codon:yes stop_codon:yes gene_type:complete
MKIVYDVDTQRDFMDEEGTLPVPNAGSIKDNINKVLEAARMNDIDILGSVDAHEEDDKEFELYPAHCVNGTNGQKKIAETIVSHSDNIYYVPNNGNGVDLSVFESSTQMYFEKQSTNIWDKADGQPDNLQTILRLLDVTEVYVIGVCTNICVYQACKGLLERDYKVTLIEDSAKGIQLDGTTPFPPTHWDAINDLGLFEKFRTITTEQYVTEIEG